MCMQLVQKPELYDVLVLPNLYGDIVIGPVRGPRRRARRGARRQHRDRGRGVRAGPRLRPQVRGPGQGQSDRPDPLGRADAPPPRRAGCRRARRDRAPRGHRGGDAHRPTTSAGARAPRASPTPSSNGSAPQPAPRPDRPSGRPGTTRRLHAPAVSGQRGDARVGVPPHLGCRHLGVHPAPRPRHLARGREPRRSTTRSSRSTPARSAGSWSRSSARRSCTTRSTACGSSSWTSGRR